jgi:hypothetical protein
MQPGQMGQKVVSDEDVEEDKVVYDPLEVVLEREGVAGGRRGGGGGLEGLEFEVEVFAEEGEVHEEEVLVLETAR